MSIHPIHNPKTVVVPLSVTTLGLSLDALGLFLFVQCQREELFSGQLARQFKTTEKEIDRLLGTLIANELIELLERAS